MKKKLFIASSIIIVIFLILLGVSLKPIKENQQESTEKITQDDLNAAKALEEIYGQYPWYGQIPIVTEDFTIAFNFEKNSFRVIFLKPSTENMKQSALETIKKIGVDLDQFSYYFIEPKQSGFENLLR